MDRLMEIASCARRAATHRLFCLALLATLVMEASTALATVAYTEDFEGNVGTQWSHR